MALAASLSPGRESAPPSSIDEIAALLPKAIVGTHAICSPVIDAALLATSGGSRLMEYTAKVIDAAPESSEDGGSGGRSQAPQQPMLVPLKVHTTTTTIATPSSSNDE